MVPVHLVVITKDMATNNMGWACLDYKAIRYILEAFKLVSKTVIPTLTFEAPVAL